MQWKLGIWHEASCNVINISNNKLTKDLEALDKETTGQAVQCSMVCLQELIFLSVFNLDLNQNTHEDCSTTPENASFSYTFSVGWKKAHWMLMGFVVWLFCFPPTCTLRRFIMLLDIHFCTSCLLFVTLPVLAPKCPFPIFYHVSSKSMRVLSSAFPCVSVSLQTLKQNFSRVLQSRMQVQGLD